MCLSPIILKNPRYGLGRIGYNALKNCETTHIYIPCGHCLECHQTKQSEFIQRFRLECLENFVAFCTLTYKPDALPHYTEDVISVDGEILTLNFDYADSSDIATMVRNLRQGSCYPCEWNNIPFKYVCFSELGGMKGRPHFHLLFFLPKSYFHDSLPEFLSWCEVHYFDVYNNWARNVGSRKFPKWQLNCEYHRRVRNGKVESNYDFHGCSPSDNGALDEVAFYVSKYLFKFSEKENKRQQFLKLNLTPWDYSRIHNLIKCRMTASKGIGSSNPKYDTNGVKFSYLRSCVQRSKESTDEYRFLKFYTSDGRTSPLGRYFYTLQNVVLPQDVVVFFDDLPCGEFILPKKVKTRTQVDNKIYHHEKILSKLRLYEPNS